MWTKSTGISQTPAKEIQAQLWRKIKNYYNSTKHNCIVVHCRNRVWNKWMIQNTARDGAGQVCPRPLKDRGNLGWEAAPFFSVRSPLLWASLSSYFSKVTLPKPSWWNHLAPHLLICINHCVGQTSQLDSLISHGKLIDGHPDYYNLLSMYLPTGQ